MIEKQKCENRHKMVVDWEAGLITDRPCINDATKYTVDNYGIFYLCENATQMTVKDELIQNGCPFLTKIYKISSCSV